MRNNKTVQNGLTSYPTARPDWGDLPWIEAHTVIARHEETSAEIYDFTVGSCEAERRELEKSLAPLKITWLALEHGSGIVDIGKCEANHSATRADAAITNEPNTAIAFTTADCLPIILASKTRQVAAGVHAGWRSLAAGIVEKTIQRLVDEYDIKPQDLRAWIGPCIARDDYEVSDDVRMQLLKRPNVSPDCFTPTSIGHCLADLPMAATNILIKQGVIARNIERFTLSTRHNTTLHSARRDADKAGRMATVIGIKNTAEPV